MIRDKVPADLLNNISAFVQVGECDSFTAAARKLNVSTSAVSKAIARLEYRLAVQLVSRTTRRISLTPEGKVYWERCKHLLNEITDIENELSDTLAKPRGPLRVRLPMAFGRVVVIPALGTFTKRYPDVVLDIRLSSGQVDMIEQGIDVAMQLGEPQDPRLVAHALCPIRYVLCAAPEYLRRHGTPRTIGELSKHRCLAYIEPRTQKQREWMLTEKGRMVIVKARGAVNVDDVHALLEIALAAEGIAYIMEFMIKDSLAAGRLKMVLPQFGYDGPTAYVVHGPTRFQSGSVRAFIEFLRELVPIQP